MHGQLAGEAGDLVVIRHTFVVCIINVNSDHVVRFTGIGELGLREDPNGVTL